VYVHGNYLLPNGNDPTGQLPYGYTPATLADQMNPALHPENFRTMGDTTYVTIPATTPPIVQPFLDLASATGTTPLVKPIVDLVSPTLRVLIELGYDRSINPGVYTQVRLIPIINPVTLTVDLINAAIQGIQAAWKDITGTAPALPAPFAPSGPSILAADNAAKLARTTQIEGPKHEPQLSPLNTRLRDNSVLANPLKTDPKPKVDVGLGFPKVNVKPTQTTPAVDGSSIPAFSLPKLPKPSISAPTLPKLPKPGNPFVPRVTDLLPKLRGAETGQTPADPTTDPNAGEQPGTPSSPGTETPAAA
jgi:hypothetical protein